MGKQAKIIGLIGIAIIILAGALTLVAGDYIRDYLIQPLLFLFVALKVYLTGLPDLLIWLFVTLVLVLIGLRAIHVQRRSRKKVVEKASPGEVRFGLIEDLARKIELAKEGEYFKWRVRRELKDFLVELVAWKGGVPREQAVDLVWSGRWTKHPEVQGFFHKGFRRRYNFFRYIVSFLKSLRRKEEVQPQDKQFFRELEFVIDYLQEYAQRGGEV